MFESLAYAQNAPGPAGPDVGILGTVVPILLMFGVAYFLLIRPQQKKAKEHRLLLEGLKKGDKVVTSGGVIGTVTGISQDVVTLQVADNVKLKVIRDGISGFRKGDEEAEKG